MAGFDPFLILNIIFIVYSAIASLFIYTKYREKQAELIKYLLLLFVFYTLYLTANTIQQWLILYNQELIFPYTNDGITFPLLPGIVDAPSLSLYIVFYTTDLILSVITSMIAFKFKNITFTGEEKTKLSIFIRYLGIGALILAACVILSINKFFTSTTGFFVTFYLFFVYVPFTTEALQSFRRAKEMKLEPRYRWGFFFIALMALCFVLRNVFLYVDVAVGVARGAFPGDPTAHTEYNLVAWVFLIVAYIAAYFGYIWPGRKIKFEK